MIQIIFKHPEFMIPILILVLLSIICQISIGVLCHKLIKETENMSSTKNRTLQQLKLKFSSCCQLHDGMSNVPVFVDKYINKTKIYGISLSTLKHLSGQLVLLSILISGIAACRGITSGESVIFIVPYYIVSFLGLYCYFAISSLVDITDKTNALRTNLIDFFENHLANRIEQTSLDLKLVQGDAADAQSAAPENTPKKMSEDIPKETPENTPKDTPAPMPTPTQPALSGAEAAELETLLKEFLT